jgi:hypothetical protein
MIASETETGFEYGESGEYGEYGEQGEYGEYGEYGEQESEQFLGSILGSALGGEVASPLSEAQEVELASELLEISSEEELEQFLGGLIKKVGGFVKGPVGRALGGVLKSVAKKALPIVGGALGSFVAPGVGTAIGSKLGSLASGLFEVELEALPAEQAEFEVARRLVGLTAASARLASAARPTRGMTPHTLARAAVAQAARRYAPGVSRQMMQALRAQAAQRRTSPAYQMGGRRAPAGVAGAVGAAPAGSPAAYWPRRPGYRPPMYVPAAGYPSTYPSAAMQEPGGDGAGGDTWADEPLAEPAGAGAASHNGGLASGGSWVRRGRRIIVFGV